MRIDVLMVVLVSLSMRTYINTKSKQPLGLNAIREVMCVDIQSYSYEQHKIT